ncbi:MAG: sterol desaturase family protein [Rhizobiales bacterium]|nr:sterol desaturase family protein [Hyphomicrobiales bacterium]
MTAETMIRFGAFLGVFLVMAVWEVLAHRRELTQHKGLRWFNNLGILLIDILVQRFTLGAAAVAMAIHAEQSGWGLFALVDWPYWLEFAIAFLILDFAIYLQHVMSHALPVFWRLHRVHHADLDFDCTTALRFHPIEILLSMLYKVAIVAALGCDAYVVIAFEVVLNGSAIFNHANVAMPQAIDRTLRAVVVTPDMHRVHHSVIVRETNSNYGFFLSIWDRLCGTYTPQPSKGHTGMTIGLHEFRDQSKLNLHDMLLLPFRKGISNYSIRPEATAARLEEENSARDGNQA